MNGSGSMSIKTLNDQAIPTQNFVNSNYMTHTGGIHKGLNFCTNSTITYNLYRIKFMLWFESSQNNWYGLGVAGSTMVINKSTALFLNWWYTKDIYKDKWFNCY